MLNLVKLTEVVWAYQHQIAQVVQKYKILRPFFANFERFFWLFGLLYPPETLELGWYTSCELVSSFLKNWQAYFCILIEKCQRIQNYTFLKKFKIKFLQNF